MNIFEMISNDEECKNILGENPTRFYPFGFNNSNTDVVYSTYQEIFNEPINLLEGGFFLSRKVLQIDIYSKDNNEVEKASKAIINVLKKTGNFESIIKSLDYETKYKRIMLRFNYIERE